MKENSCDNCVIEKCINRKWGHVCEFYTTQEDRIKVNEE